MKNQKIGTLLGIIIIVIFSITVGVFVWVVEKGQETEQVPNTAVQQNVIPKNQEGQNQTTVNTQVNKYTDTTYGFEFEYPNGWDITKSTDTTSDKQNLVFVFSTNGQLTDDIRGSLLFGKYDIYNNSLTNSVDDNVSVLNSKVNIIGPASTYKEIRIEGGRAFINQTQSTIASNEREIVIVGKKVIFNGNVSVNYKNTMDVQKLDKFAEILSHFKFIH